MADLAWADRRSFVVYEMQPDASVGDFVDVYDLQGDVAETFGEQGLVQRLRGAGYPFRDLQGVEFRADCSVVVMGEPPQVYAHGSPMGEASVPFLLWLREVTPTWSAVRR